MDWVMCLLPMAVCFVGVLFSVKVSKKHKRILAAAGVMLFLCVAFGSLAVYRVQKITKPIRESDTLAVAEMNLNSFRGDVEMNDLQTDASTELYQALDETFIEKRPDHKAMMSNLQKGELLGVGGSMCNVFEPLVLKEHFDINYIRSMMYTYGAYGAQMTGSGSAVFGIYDSFEYATVACTMLKDKYEQVFLAKNV